MEIITALTLLTVLVVMLTLYKKGKLTVLLAGIQKVYAAASLNSSIILVLGSIVVLTGMFLYLFYRPPGWNIGPEQPIPFSHRLHAGVKQIDCRFCHPYVGRSLHPGIPPVEKCLYCHNYIITKHPEILKEHQYFNTGTPVPWRKANYLAEHVLFNHERHIKKEIDCRQCHGPVEAMDRIKGTYFRMQFCINCHRQKKVNLGCWLACHS